MEKENFNRILLEVHRNEYIILCKQIYFSRPFTNAQKCCFSIRSTRWIFVHISQLSKEETIKKMKSMLFHVRYLILEIPAKMRFPKCQTIFNHNIDQQPYNYNGPLKYVYQKRKKKKGNGWYIKQGEKCCHE